MCDANLLMADILNNDWVLTEKEKPILESNVLISDNQKDTQSAIYTADRTCMLAGSGGGNGYFDEGFATDGSTGCETGLILDEPKYWRYI